MRTLSLLLAIALVTFSGCTESPTVDDVPAPGPAGGNQTASPTPAADGNANGTLNATNAAPVANLTADVVNGTAPLAVVFTIHATDADGDVLTWSLTSNGTLLGNGTTFPATLNATFEQGNFTVVLTVDDGNATANATVQVSAAAAAANAASQDLSFSYPLSNNAGCAGAPYDAAPTAGVNYDEQAIDAATWGQPWTATIAASEFTVYLTFRDASGSDLETHVGGVLDGGWDFTGTVPSGAATLALYGCLGTPGGSGTYHAGP